MNTVPQAAPLKRRRRALLFAGGGVDTAMQLGVAHALLVSGGAPPDYVMGVSAGAVNAAAVAEVLQAGPPGLPREEQATLSYADRLPFQVDKLRTFIESYLELPRTLFDAILPDSLEILARDPLAPLDLPIHFDKEREAREVANEAKAGIVRVLNDLLAIRLSVGTATRMARKVLGRSAAAELPGAWGRFSSTVGNELGLLWIFWARFFETAPLVATLCLAYAVGPNRAVLRGGFWAALGGFRADATANRLMSRSAFFRKALYPIRFFRRSLLMAHLFAAATAAWILSVVLRPIGRLIGLLRRRRKPGSERFTRLRGFWSRLHDWLAARFQAPLTRILRYYGLADGLASTDVLKQLLVRCFDQEYYGRTELTDVLNRSLDRYNKAALATDVFRKRLCDYQTNHPPIHVATVAARVKDGSLCVLGSQVPVVDALLAATAKVPLFPAVRINEVFELDRAKAAVRQHQNNVREDEAREERWIREMAEAETARAHGQPKNDIPVPEPHRSKVQVPSDSDDGYSGEWFIDGANVSNEAIGPLLNYVRDVLSKDEDQSASVDVYRVSSLPISNAQLPSKPKQTFDGVLGVVPRALQLKRFRDAKVEQRLTELYTRALPGGQSFWRHPKTGKVFVNARVFPLEPQQPVEIHKRLLDRQQVGYRELVYQTIADGCRASLEGMLPSLIKEKAGKETRVLCETVIGARIGDGPRLPGRDEHDGPGLSEICKRCALNRNAERHSANEKAALCRSGSDRRDWPEWPAGEPETPLALIPPRKRSRKSKMDLGDWPRMRNWKKGTERPIVSLLFGGGVFRGVFHMGVMNALNEVGLYPDVVAGSSVGSIVAAMIAQVFSTPVSRQREIAHLAATFLSIDRLVLTDRFADFIRRLTLHAAETNFSLHDLDLLFRRYDDESAAGFNRRLRLVSAGMERLSNISPFELLDLTRDLRLDQFAAFLKSVGDDLQEFLDRNGIGLEVLGADPLALLIQNHVLSGRRAKERTRDDIFESFRDCGIYFLATATNLEKGALEILGQSQLASAKEPSLLYGLLASSAFPAIFRPRHSWEIFRQTNDAHRYIDGGVMDNLPLDAVARFLDGASHAGVGAIARRPRLNGPDSPPVPHLIFTALLETDPVVESDRGKLEELVGDCIRLWKRAKTLKYNQKINAFATTQRDLRSIWEGRVAESGKPPGDPLLDLHIMTVKPKWLCSTFGFHPMLGFRRRKQAQSIAHGCASTLATIYQTQRASDRYKCWVESWGIREGLDFDADCFAFSDANANPSEKEQMKSNCDLLPARVREPDVCWFRTQSRCPFSPGKLTEAGVAKEKIEEISQIYRVCGDAASHSAGEQR
jgi:predicted acylesterase/phospholipase RssA